MKRDFREIFGKEGYFSFTSLRALSKETGMQK